MSTRFFSFAILILSVGIIFYYIKPTWSVSIPKEKKRIESYTKALEAVDNFKKKEAELTQAQNSIPKESLDKLNIFLPDSVDNVQLILDLNALAARAGVTLSNFTVQGGVNSGTGNTTASSTGTSVLSNNNPVDSLQIGVSATGSYNSFRAFLSGLEKSLRPLDVTSVNVTQGPLGIYTYEIAIRMYWLH
jgi:Tfp pilus assembly protein PilO